MINDKRICRTCNQAKLPSEFYKDSRYPEGDIHCANCRKEKVKKWRDANPERAKQIQRKSRNKNPEAARKRASEWHKKNRDRHLQYMAYRRANFSEAVHMSKLKSIFGITADEYKKLVSQQDGKCAICRKCPKQNKKRLAVDHCHQSNKIRGLLCSTCNQALGLFKDSTALLESAITYLNSHE